MSGCTWAADRVAAKFLFTLGANVFAMEFTLHELTNEIHDQYQILYCMPHTGGHA